MPETAAGRAHQWRSRTGKDWTPHTKSDACGLCGHTPDSRTHMRADAALRGEERDAICLPAKGREALWEKFTGGEKLAYGCGYRDGRAEARALGRAEALPTVDWLATELVRLPEFQDRYSDPPMTANEARSRAEVTESKAWVAARVIVARLRAAIDNLETPHEQ